MKIKWNNKTFVPLNIINVKTSPHVSKGILRHHHFLLDTKLGLCVVAMGIIPCKFHPCTTMLYLYWDSNTKGAVNQPRCGILYNCKYCKILGLHNNWIIMIIFDDGTFEEYYEHINWTIIDGNLMNIYLIIIEMKYGAIGADDYSS